jgi:hypothetical protein
VGNPLSCKIADEFKDDFNDDRVRKGCRSAERSTASARHTALTYVSQDVNSGSDGRNVATIASTAAPDDTEAILPTTYDGVMQMA